MGDGDFGAKKVNSALEVLSSEVQGRVEFLYLIIITFSSYDFYYLKKLVS